MNCGLQHKSLQKIQKSLLGRRGRGCESLPSRFFVLHPPAKKLAWRPISACLHIPWAIFHFFRKRNPHPKSCQSPSNTLSCERYTASPVCASVVANAFSCILSPYTMAPHAAVRLGLPARRQKKRTMIFPFSLIKVIRSLSLYSPGCCVFTFVAHVKHRHRPRTVRRFFTKKSRETMARRRNTFTKISWAYFPRETLVRSFARI